MFPFALPQSRISRISSRVAARHSLPEKWYVCGRQRFLSGKKSSGKKKKSSGQKGRPKPSVVKKEEEERVEKVIDPKVKEWNEAQMRKLKKPKQPTVRIAEKAAASPARINEDGLLNGALPQGSVVYHGTTLGGLQSVQSVGRIIGSSPDVVALGAYTPPDAVYVSSALKALAHASRHACEEVNADSEDLPVLLEIKIPETGVEVCIDHDYFLSGKGILSGIMEPVRWEARQEFYTTMHLDQELVNISWCSFCSVGVLRDIPQSWISAIYAPRVRGDGSLHSQSLSLFARASFAEVAKAIHAEELNFWQCIEPLALVSDKDMDFNLGEIFDAQLFRDQVTSRMQSQNISPTLSRAFAESGGDLTVIDRMMVEECHKLASVDVRSIIHRIRERFI